MLPDMFVKRAKVSFDPASQKAMEFWETVDFRGIQLDKELNQPIVVCGKRIRIALGRPRFIAGNKIFRNQKMVLIFPDESVELNRLSSATDKVFYDRERNIGNPPDRDDGFNDPFNVCIRNPFRLPVSH